jgi:outer membrane receptor for ferrienterochelin and colicins
MTSVALNARGFNSSFNNRMLMMEDGRIAVLPENGLPVGQFTASPRIDLAGIEVLVGPGAALYGADASSGVVTLQSKDPRRFQGTTFEGAGGSRQFMNVQARHAGLIGTSWGFKLAGEYQQANDWDNYLTYTIAGVPNRGNVPVREDEIPGNSIDWSAKVMRGIGSAVHYSGDNRLEISAGASVTDGVGQTNVGRNQLRGWKYNFAQAQYSTPRLYLNAYRTQSQSGESFAINRYADAYARNPTLSPDSLRMLSDWPSNGRLYAAEAQHNFRLPQFLNTTVTWGAQFRRDVVSSDRQWLTDRLTGQDLEIDQKGIYAQVETPVLPQMSIVAAGRIDQHENYDAQFSPKFGVVYKPAPQHAFRVTYNRAFKSPTVLQTNFHIPDWTAVVAIYGNTQGFTVRDANGNVQATYDALRPEENTTYELGYKGILGQRLFLDGAYYRSRYEHFMSPLVIISNPFTAAPTYAHDASGQRIVNDAGLAPVTLIYYNLGRADLQGVDAGVNFYALPRLTFSATFSWLDVMEVEVPLGREEATSTNAPNTKWTLGANLLDIAGPAGGFFHANSTLRHVTSHYFRSGINFGVIPTFSTLDLGAGYRLPRFNTSINVGVNNLFSCSQQQDTPLAYSDPLRTTPTNKERQCGFNMKHTEMINMPAIGTMVFVGARYHLSPR